MSVELAINVRSRDANETGGHKNIRIPAMIFDEMSINLKFDSVASTFKFGLDFDPINKDHAELACPTHMHECELDFIYDSGYKERMITGFMLSQGFGDTVKPEPASIGGYSRAGLLGDCDIPLSCPLESNGLTYTQVVGKVLNSLNAVRKATINNPLKFKIKSSRANQVLTDVDRKKKDDSGGDSANLQQLLAKIQKKTDAVIPKTTAPESQNALSYLKNIAIQKRLILSHDEFGNLIVGVPNTKGKPLFEVDNTEFGTIGITDIRCVIDGQQLHSHITVIRQADKDDGNAAEYTIENPFCPIVYRPKVVSLSFGDDVSIQEMARNELGNDLKAIRFKVSFDRWVVDGKLLRPNNTFIIKAPKAYLYEKTRLFIEEVDFIKNPKQDEVVATCVLTSVYDDDTPINCFVPKGKNTPLS